MSASKNGGVLQADVQVQNRAGHNFLRGELSARLPQFPGLDAGGNVLWASGDTNSDGVIVDNSGTPLVTEFFSPRNRAFNLTSGRTIR